LLTRISLYTRWILVTLGVIFVFQVFSTVYSAISGSSLMDVIFLLAGDMHTDRDDRTNFLLMGVGGEGHDGGDLTDTFIVASYSHDYGTLSLLSIPRDFWVEAGDGVGMRVNKIYEYEKIRLEDSEASLETVAEVASRIADIPIHYYAKIDFTGFTDLIDAMGGVKVLVEEPIDDPYYPCPGLNGYCPFHITAGLHNLNGDTALQFARSRKTTSDFSRAARQQQLLEAMREKALSMDLLTNPKKLKAVYDVVGDSIETNLSWRELVALADIGADFDRKNMATLVLSDESTYTGGLLYTPPREEYGGAAVLLPDGNDYRKIQLLTDILFTHPRVIIDQLSIEVLNASGYSGVAEDVAYYLNRYGLNSARINNYPDRQIFPKTTLYHYGEERTKETAEVLSGFIDADWQEGGADLSKRGFDLTVVIGEDYRASDYE